MKFLFSALLIFFVFGSVTPGRADNHTPTNYAGKTLEQALRDLQMKGLNVVYSSDLVRPEMKVVTEPPPGSPREVLKRLLLPYGLKAEDGPVNTLLVVYQNGAAGKMAPGDPGSLGDASAFVLVPFININLIAMDENNQYVTNLTADDFVVKENGIPQQIVDFANHSYTEQPEDEPLTIIFLLDCSQSMSKVSSPGMRRLDLIKDAAIELLKYFTDNDRFIAMGFSTHPWIITELTDNFQEVREGIANQRTVFERTALFDSMIAALKTAQESFGRKIIILCSDGEDNISKTTMKELLPALGSSDVTVFSIAATPAGAFAKEGAAQLKKITEVSGGGSFFYSNSDDVHAIMVNAGQAIRSQYSIGYYPRNDNIHGWRRLEVLCKIPKIHLRYRKNYLF